MDRIDIEDLAAVLALGQRDRVESMLCLVDVVSGFASKRLDPLQASLVISVWRDNCGGRSAAIMMAGIRRRRVVDF